MDKESSRMITITARIPKSVADELRVLAENEGRSMNNYLNKLFIALVKEKERGQAQALAA